MKLKAFSLRNAHIQLFYPLCAHTILRTEFLGSRTVNCTFTNVWTILRYGAHTLVTVQSTAPTAGSQSPFSCLAWADSHSFSTYSFICCTLILRLRPVGRCIS